MTIASEISDLQTNLANAKSAITARGGTVGNTGLAGLASEITTIPSSGGYTGTPYGKMTIVSDYGVKWEAFGTNCTVTIVDEDLWKSFYSGSPSTNQGLGYEPVSIYNQGVDIVGEIEDLGGSGKVTFHDVDYNTVEKFWDTDNPTSLSLEIGIEIVFDEGETQGQIDMNGQFYIDLDSPTVDITIPNSTVLNSMNFENDIISINGLTIPKGCIVGFEFGNAITSIPNGFLARVNTLKTVNLDYATSLTSIGNDFLAYCYMFNSPLTLPEGLLTIGNNFLLGDYTFNQSLTLPSTLTSIGTNFLRNTDSMTSVIDVGSLSPSIVTVESGVQVEGAFCASSPSASSYTTGIQIKTNSVIVATDWFDRFPNGSWVVGTTHYYRHLLLAF